jgi:hypothetical protein
MEWRKYCRKISGDKPLLLDRGQNRPERRRLHGTNHCSLFTIGTSYPPPTPSRVPQPENDSMAAIGRLGQFLGLAIPAVAVLLELNRAISLGQMLVMLVAAVCCFWIGRILEGYARSS